MDTGKTWEKTPRQNLVRHKSGGYYARLYLKNREIWKSLKTKSFSVAEARLTELLKEHRQRRSRETGSSSVKMSFGQAAELHMQRVATNVNLKSRTKAFWKDLLASVLRSWPEISETEIRKITPVACREWAAAYAKSVGATRFNHALELVKHVIALGMESGVVFTNVAADLKNRRVTAKKLELPTLSQFSTFIEEMKKSTTGVSSASAELAEGLAYTGCRVSEAARIEWRDLNFAAGEIFVKGDAIEATKNGEVRRVPMIPGARVLFEGMRAKRPNEAGEKPVFEVKECQRAMDRAAKKTGMTRITHHDLRHFFATVCIESGVDIPTVSRWLGHRDGGALAMKTYGHLRREHSLAQAQKVSFAPRREMQPT